MTRILGLAAAVAWLAQASSALGIEVSQRTQGQALQAPVQFRAKSSPPEVDASLPRQEWKNKDTREKRAKERSVTKEKSAKRRGERKTVPATSRQSEEATVTRSQHPTPLGDSKPLAASGEASESTTTWSTDEVLEARARCVELLAPIIAEVIVAPAIRAGPCGTPAPIVLKSIGTSIRVAMNPPITVNCKMAAALHTWLEQNVQPAARQFLGEEIAAVSGALGYQCRNRADIGRTSQHGFANAIDILGFVTRSGRRLSVLDDWGPTDRGRPDEEPTTSGQKGQNQCAARESLPTATPGPPSPQGPGKIANPSSAPADRQDPCAEPRPEQQFLKRIHQEACGLFDTVLGPDANKDHHNHFHLDLAERSRRSSYCR
jgi:hypothetical protein